MNISNVKDKWEAMKPSLKGFFWGLVIGPFIIVWIGWTVPSYSVQKKIDAALLNLKTSICVARARHAVKDPTKLEWEERSKLAEKWGTMPGAKAGSSDFDVTSACAQELANAPDSSPAS